MTTLPRVLIVDYDPKALRTLQDVFTENGYQVQTAKDGAAALNSFRDFKPSIVLLEAMIPKKHGFEVCQEIKKTPEGRSTPVIIMTAVYKGRKYKTQAMHVHGCDEFVEKPCSPDSLLEIIKRFVPPGAKPAAKTPAPPPGPVRTLAQEETRGTVIPFPAERSGFTLPDFEEDAEREIMSKLDEIMPDTPMFSQRGTGGGRTMTAVAPQAVETVAKVGSAFALSTVEVQSEPSRSDARTQTVDAPRERTTAGKTAASSEEVSTVLKKSRQPQAAGGSEPEPKKRRLLSPLFIVLFVVSLLIAVGAYVLGHA